MRIKEARLVYTFDDLMLVPQYSDIPSRKDASINIGTNLTSTLKLDIPIVAAPMNTITEHDMIKAMSVLGGSSVLHRYMSSDDQLQQCVRALSGGSERRAKNFFIAVGATGDFVDRVKRFYDTLGWINFCIDVANGHSQRCLRAVEALMKEVDKGKDILNIMAGNVCEYMGAMRLVEAGVKIVRVGVGPGSVCKTRIVTGHGVPQLSAIDDCAQIKEHYDDVTIVADGGIRNSGDIVKALAAGADAVMLGGLLAGTIETPGSLHTDTTGIYKVFAGMASEEGRKFNGWFTEENASFVPEGESIKVACKGHVESVVSNLVGGLRVGMSYAGARSIKELHENAEWVRVTENGRAEGTPHALYTRGM